MKKRSKSIILIVIGLILGASITVTAALVTSADNISFKSRNSEWNVENVSTAIDDLYSKKESSTSSITIPLLKGTSSLYNQKSILYNYIDFEILNSYKYLSIEDVVVTNVNNDNALYVRGFLNENDTNYEELYNQKATTIGKNFGTLDISKYKKIKIFTGLSATSVESENIKLINIKFYN